MNLQAGDKGLQIEIRIKSGLESRMCGNTMCQKLLLSFIIDILASQYFARICHVRGCMFFDLSFYELKLKLNAEEH
jgi:hypothetical protein